MDIVKLEARNRTGRGKSYTRKARAEGWLPAVYYGHGLESKAIEVNAREFAKLVRARQTTHLIGLHLDGEELPTVIKEIQRDVLRLEGFEHVDFQHVSMDEKVTMEIPVEVEGTPVGVKESGGILEHPVRHVMVACLPGNIPEKVAVDVSGLDVGDSIHIRDIDIADVEIKNSPDEVVAAVSAPTKEELPEEVVAEGEEGGAEGGEAEAAAAAGGEAEEKASES